MDWFPWYPTLYRADTLDLTLEQDGAYRRLIDHYMETRLPLPNNDNALARIIGISFNEFQAIAEQVRCKFTAKGQHLHSKRCDIELDRQDNKSRKRSNAAKAAHEKRKKNNDIHATAQQPPSKCTDRGEERRGEDKEDNIDLFGSFADFYEDYPKKVGKVAAEKAYAKALKTTTHETIMEGLKLAKVTWENTEKKFIPNPATWLNAGRWADEHEIDPETGNSHQTTDFVGTHIDSERNKWILRIRSFKERELWMDHYGPPPNDPGCEAPSDLLKEFQNA